MTIEPWVYPVLTGVAVLAGFVDSIAGGGGLITMPALLSCGIPPLQALGTSKLQSTMGTAVALSNYGRSGLLNWQAHRWNVAAVFAGAATGALVVQIIDVRALSVIIPVLLGVAAVYVLLSPRSSRLSTPTSTITSTPNVTSSTDKPTSRRSAALAEWQSLFS